MARNSKGRFQRAASAVRNVTQNDPNHFNLSRFPPIIERIATAMYHIVMTTGVRAATISVSEIIKQVEIDAGLNGETLGPRTVQTIHLRLSRLGTNQYIRFLDRELEWFAVTEDFKALIQGLVDMLATHGPLIDSLGPVKKYRVKCAFFRAKFGRNLKRHVTRRELDLENRRLILEAEEHARLCPLSNTPAPSLVSQGTEFIDDPTRNAAAGSSSIVSGENARVDSDSLDSMYLSMDDVPMAGPSRLTVPIPHTPARSGTLNNLGAYPTPESAARQVSAMPSTSSGTPSLSYSPTASGLAEEDLPSDEDEEMEVDIELQGMPGILFAQDIPASLPVDSTETEAMIRYLKEKIEKMEEQHQRDLEYQTRLYQDELNQRLLKAEFDKTEFNDHIHDMQSRHDVEMQNLRERHALETQALHDRYEAEKKELEERLEAEVKKGRKFGTLMANFYQHGAGMFEALGPEVQTYRSTFS